MMRRKPTRRDLLVVVGRLQVLVGEVSASHGNDRDPNGFEKGMRALKEAVEAGISGEDRRVAFEREFLAYVVGPGGKTVYEAILEGVGGHGRLLPSVSEGGSL